MGLIGKIWVKLGLDNSEFKQGIQGAEKEASGFQNFIKGVGPSIAAAFSISAIVNFGKAAIKAYNESAAAAAKLENIIKSTGGTAGLTANEMMGYARELQRVTTFEDDATINAMALLATFKSIKGDIFKQTIASAQDLATVLGTDLNGAVMQLGKALEAPELGLTMLRRSGISFSTQQIEQVKKLLEENKKYEAQLIILREVQSQFGGAAKAAAETAGGSWQQMFNALGDVMEQIGSIVEHSTGLVRKLTKALEDTSTILASKVITNWQKFALIVSKFSPREWFTGSTRKELAGLATDAAKNAEAQMEANRKIVDQEMQGIKGIKDARIRLFKATHAQITAEDKANKEALETYSTIDEIRVASLKSYIATQNEQKDAQEMAAQAAKDEAEAYAKTAEGVKEAQEKAKQAALERAKYIMGTSAYYERLIKEARELNEVEENANLRADRELEIRNLEYKLELTKKTKDELKEIQALRARDIRAGGEVPYVQNTITGKVTTNQSDPITGLKTQTDTTLGVVKEFNDELDGEVQRSAQIAAAFGQTVARSISDSMQVIFDSVMSGEDIDMASLTKALLTPFADMAVQMGEMLIATGAGALAAQAIGEAGGGWGAIAAGAALVAIGTAARAAIGTIGSNFGKGSTGSAPLNMGAPAVATASPSIDVVGIVKGEDIWLINKKVDNRKGR